MRFLTSDEVKRLSTAEAAKYCNALRNFLVKTVSVTGGHLASNLGIAEISVALVRSLSLPEEKIVYDTGHQSYIHKLLTGRGEDFSSLRSFGGISGFPRREESEFDAFGTGHSGTGISAALGFAKANRLLGKKDFTVAVIGDGSFTGGMVFEALNNVSPHDRLIIILNDNGMSIGKSVGALKGALNRMRTSGYYKFKDGVQNALESIPLVGKELADVAKKAKDTVKKSALPMGNLFEQYGLHYFGPANGNNLETVEFLLSEAKKKNGPSIIHLCTKKGKGLAEAEKDPSRFHGLSPKRGEKTESSSPSFSKVFGDTLCRLGKEDERIVAITAAMADGVGLGEFSKKFPQRFFDVGIAEEHAVTFAAGLAAAGLRPCFAVYSTFFQRAYDQLLHDAALQKLPITVCLDRAGVSGEDGSTHHGLFDVAMTLPIPGVKIYAPTTEKEMERALKSAFEEKEVSSVIRYPKGNVSPIIENAFPFENEIEKKDFGIDPKICVVSYGRTLEACLQAAEALSQKGISVRVIRFGMLKGYDETLLSSLFPENAKLLLVEEGMEEGGFAQSLFIQLIAMGLSFEKTKILAVRETFVPHGSQKELLKLLCLDKDTIEKELIQLAKA